MAALEKALLTNTVDNSSVEVLFNPAEYALAKENAFAQAAVPGLSAPLLQFVNGGLETLEMELFLDTLEEHRVGDRVVSTAGQDVRELAGRIAALMAIQPATHAPPVVIFSWGQLSFRCVLARLQQRYTLFLPDGTPVRARLAVALHGYTNAEMEARETKRETADYSRRQVVGQGQTLHDIAFAAYGDPRLWRPIALRNAVADPLRPETGRELLIPRLPYRDPATGKVHQ